MFFRGDKNYMGCFVRGGKSIPDVLSGCQKMAWDVLSQDVLSYILVYQLPRFGWKNRGEQKNFHRLRQFSFYQYDFKVG